MAKRRQHRGSILRVQTGAPTALIARNSFSANTHLTSGRRRPQQQGGSSNSPLRLVHHQRGTSFGAFSVGPNGAVPTRTSRHARTPGGASVTFQDIDAIVPPARMQALSAETGPRVHQALGQACEDLSMLSKRGGSGRRKAKAYKPRTSITKPWVDTSKSLYGLRAAIAVERKFKRMAELDESMRAHREALANKRWPGGSPQAALRSASAKALATLRSPSAGNSSDLGATAPARGRRRSVAVAATATGAGNENSIMASVVAAAMAGGMHNAAHDRRASVTSGGTNNRATNSASSSSSSSSSLNAANHNLGTVAAPAVDVDDLPANFTASSSPSRRHSGLESPVQQARDRRRRRRSRAAMESGRHDEELEPVIKYDRDVMMALRFRLTTQPSPRASMRAQAALALSGYGGARESISGAMHDAPGRAFLPPEAKHRLEAARAIEQRRLQHERRQQAQQDGRQRHKQPSASSKRALFGTPKADTRKTAAVATPGGTIDTSTVTVPVPAEPIKFGTDDALYHLLECLDAHPAVAVRAASRAIKQWCVGVHGLDLTAFLVHKVAEVARSRQANLAARRRAGMITYWMQLRAKRINEICNRLIAEDEAEELRRINERPDHIKYDEREQALASISVHLHRQRSDPRPRWLQNYESTLARNPAVIRLAVGVNPIARSAVTRAVHVEELHSLPPTSYAAACDAQLGGYARSKPPPWAAAGAAAHNVNAAGAAVKPK